MNIKHDGAEIDDATNMQVYGEWIKFTDGEGATVKIPPSVIKKLMDFARAIEDKLKEKNT
jgi:hypothetical protein